MNDAPAARDPTPALSQTRVESEKVLLDGEAISAHALPDRARDHRAQPRPRRASRSSASTRAASRSPSACGG